MNTFVFKAEGATLTGTVAGGQDETAIKNGKISGDDISFTAERPFGTFTYTGKVTGAEIKFKVTFKRPDLRNDGQTYELSKALRWPETCGAISTAMIDSLLHLVFLCRHNTSAAP